MKKKNDRPTFWNTVYQETRDLIVLPFINYFRCGKIWLDIRTGLVNFVEDDSNMGWFFIACLIVFFVPWAVLLIVLSKFISVLASMCFSTLLSALIMLLIMRYIFFKAEQYKAEQQQELRNIAYTKLEEDELPAEVEERVEEMLREQHEAL